MAHYTNLLPVSLQKAAEAFHLSPDSEWHREILVRILSELMFGEGKKGRPRDTLKWHPEREYDLGGRFCELKQERPNIKYSQAAKVIMRRYPEEYVDCSETTLRQRLPAAYSFWEECQELDARQSAEYAAERDREKTLQK